MNFLSIEYFLVIAEELNLSRAARRLFVSQQSLSEHVKKLETELGTPLLKRGRALSLTPAGECFVQGSNELLDARNRMLHEIELLTVQRRRKLTIAISTFDTPPFLPSLLAEFSAAYPQYEALVVKRLASDVAQHMDGVDLYFSFLPLSDSLEHVYLLEDDPFVAVVNSTLALQTYGEQWPQIEQQLLATKDLALLKQLPFIFLFDRDGMLARDLATILKSYALTPNVGFQSENGDLNAAMCARGAGILLAPQDYCRRKFSGYANTPGVTLGMYPIETPGLKCALALSYTKGKHLHAAEKSFIELARNFLNNQAI